ncbi:hypothetical protein NFI96_001784 [Prochilodus magdalenae]|nr:hypothetical protein NFI96_001784 [Prochilodus magdalenae]
MSFSGEGSFSTSREVQPGSQTKGVGIFQILIGFIHVVCGIVLAVTVKSVSFYPGIIFWGAVTYIPTGIMTIMAGNKKPRLMKCSMGMNILTILTGGTIVILMALEFADALPFNPCQDIWSYFHCSDIKWGLKPFCMIVTPTSGLQVFISIVNVTYEYKASCYPEPAAPVAGVAPSQAAHFAEGSPLRHHSHQQDVFYITTPSMNLNKIPTDNPPPIANVFAQAIVMT